VAHALDAELGTGEIRRREGRRLDVFFPDANRTLTLAADAPLLRVALVPGGSARVRATREVVRVAAVAPSGVTLADGRVLAVEALWPLPAPPSPIDALIAGQLDSLEAFANRLDGLRLAALREAGGLGSFLGGRIELFPHQLHTALRAVERDPVRWLLADEVGLGKTVEACLILSALLRTKRASRALVIAPAALTVQWLGELYRKFHQVLTLLDDERLGFVAREFGAGANPFVAHRSAVVALEMLGARPELLEQALASEPDMIVVDEAHRLAEPALLAGLGPLVRCAHHALLLTATPLAHGLPGFYTLLELLHPEAFRSYSAFERDIDAGRAVLPCVSAVRREDLGGFPPRVPLPIGLRAAIDLEATVGAHTPPHGDGSTKDAAPRDVMHARPSLRRDPRARWIAEQTPAWRARREKALIFVSSQALLERLETYLRETTGEDVATFHEGLDIAERDIRLARFLEGDGALLLCSDAGSEGRNFQTCHRMVHFDLPDDPVRLEQRIGRLDRIGRELPVEIVYFRPAHAVPDVAALYERLGLFATPQAGIDAALAGARAAIERARRDRVPLDVAALAASMAEARTSAARRAPRALYPDAYTPALAERVKARVPRDLEPKTERYCIEAARQLGLKVIPHAGVARYYIELSGRSAGTDAREARAAELVTRDWEELLTRVESLPGVSIPDLPGHGNEVRFLGTFDRVEAIQHQSLAFFSNGQMLVEGLMAELEDSPRGRATAFELRHPKLHGSGLLCLYRDGVALHPVAIDAGGTLRPEWVEPLLAGLRDARPLKLAPERSDRRGPRSHGGAPPASVGDALRSLGARIAESAPPGELAAAALFRAY
jgi:ATP-dependent helicase HepA